MTEREKNDPNALFYVQKEKRYIYIYLYLTDSLCEKKHLPDVAENE